MGFLDKYAFPTQIVYNVINKEGGGKCSGSADLSLETIVKKCRTGNCGNKRKSTFIKRPKKNTLHV